MGTVACKAKEDSNGQLAQEWESRERGSIEKKQGCRAAEREQDGEGTQRHGGREPPPTGTTLNRGRGGRGGPYAKWFSTSASTATSSRWENSKKWVARWASSKKALGLASLSPYFMPALHLTPLKA